MKQNWKNKLLHALWRHIIADTPAQATLEFVLVFPLVLLLVMGIIDMGGLAKHTLVTKYAAFCVARACSTGENSIREKSSGSFMSTPSVPEGAAAIALLAYTPKSVSIAGNSNMFNNIVGDIANDAGSVMDWLFKDLLGVDDMMPKLAYLLYMPGRFNTFVGFPTGSTFTMNASSYNTNYTDAPINSYIMAAVYYPYFTPFPRINTVANLASTWLFNSAAAPPFPNPLNSTAGTIQNLMGHSRWGEWMGYNQEWEYYPEALKGYARKEVIQHYTPEMWRLDPTADENYSGEIFSSEFLGAYKWQTFRNDYRMDETSVGGHRYVPQNVPVVQTFIIGRE